MIVVPLVLTSLITGVTNIGKGSNLGRLSIKTLLYYLSTSLVAIITGLLLVNLIKPGVGSEITLNSGMEKLDIIKKPFADTLIEIISDFDSS